MLDRLIGRYARHLNQNLMTFRGSSADTRLPSPDPNKQYLLYLHVPFCVVLCPFCSFHRVEFREDRAIRYFEALQKEIAFATDMGYRFGEVYVGGGTPTVLPDLLADTIEEVAAAHSLTAVSVETNPLDLDAGKLMRLENAGVNRLSVGVQSFDDGLLREMERFEKYGSGSEIVTHLQGASGTFDTLNVDMIFNFPHQDEKILRADLVTLTDELAVDQVSWYPLMTSAATARPMAKKMGSVDYAREKRFYEIIVQHMLDAGYQRSSAWCFSRRPGMFDEYIVEHEEYLGLGSGAFSYLGGAMYANTFSINSYLHRIAEGKCSAVQNRELSLPEQMRYYLLMQLFSGRLDLAAAERRFDGSFDRTLWRDLAGLRLIGAVTSIDNELRLTESGYYLWVVLMREFFSGVNSFRDDMRHNISTELTRKHADFG
jgi:coproporphyrinogen III oxidase-like Fe-S oxidoreductase